jgi:hypothetical protein
MRALISNILKQTLDFIDRHLRIGGQKKSTIVELTLKNVYDQEKRSLEDQTLVFSSVI